MPEYYSERDKTLPLRRLVPKSFHFDGYNELHCPNSRDAPFFTPNSVEMGKHLLNISTDGSDTISLNFSSPCSDYYISFEPYNLSISEYAEKVRDAVYSDRDFITLDIKVKRNFNKGISHFGCEYCHKTSSCAFYKNREKESFMAAISFEMSDMKKSLDCYFGITSPKKSMITKGTNVMKNTKGFMGMNFEFGMSKDPNIAATLLGVCVKNPKTGSWHCFDPNKNTVKSITCKVGDFPIFLLPVRQLEPGCLYKKKDGNYEFVKSIDPVTNTIQWIRPIDGVIREALPEESMIPGFNFYTKVAALDTNSLTDPTSKTNMTNNVIAAICMMQWNNNDGDAEFSIDNIDDSSFNGLGALMPLLLMNGNSGLGGLGLPGGDSNMDLTTLIALGAGMNGGDNNQMIQGLLLSGLLTGSSSASPLSGIIPGIAPTVAATEGSVICTSCNKTYGSDTAFCPTCGSKTYPVGSYCKSCGAELKPDSLFCHKCGTKVGESTCPSCGTTLTDDANFCPKCGQNVKAAAPVATASKKPAGKSTKPKAAKPADDGKVVPKNEG